MTRDEVKNLVHDYFDNLLSPEEKSRIESYLEEYEDTAKEYELLKKLLTKAELLPVGIKTPDTLLGKISDELLSKSLEKIEEDKQKKLRQLTENTEAVGEERKKISESLVSKRKSGFTSSNETDAAKVKSTKPLIILVVLLMAVGAYFLYDFLNTNLPWQLKLEYGNYQIGTAGQKSSIDIEETLTTFDSTKVAMIIPNAGRVDVGSFSSLKIIKGKDSDNIFSLVLGKIYGNCRIDNPKLKIKTNLADIEVIAGRFTLELNNSGDLNLATDNGMLKVTTPAREILLVKDHRLRISANGNIGMPIHLRTNAQLAEIIEQFSFGDSKVIDHGLILQLATPIDGLTLLHLIMKAKTIEERIPIFEKLSEFYPLIPGITNEGILNLDKNMLDEWHRDIEWQL